MQLFQQKFLQKISFWKTFPPPKNHNTLQINKLKIFSENFNQNHPPQNNFFTHPITTPSPIHLSIHSIYQTYIIYSDYLPKRTPSETAGYGKCFKRHTSKHQQSHPIPLCHLHPQTSNQPLASLPMVGLITTPLKTQIAHFPLQFKVHNKFIETE